MLSHKILHYRPWQPPQCHYLFARGHWPAIWPVTLHLGWPPELTILVVNKYFPTTCPSCALGNLQSTDVYDHFKTTPIGHTEFDLKVWTTVDSKRAYSFKKHYISATCIDLLTGMLFGSTFTSRKSLVRWIRQLCANFRRAGHPLTFIRADNEFDAKETRRFRLEADIDLVFSRPHQKDKTHRVERSHRTVQEMVVKMVNDRSHLNFCFWAYAFNHALVLLNLPEIPGDKI